MPIEAVAFTNAAKCQAVDAGKSLQRLCLMRWPVERLLAILQPGLVVTTSATVLEHLRGQRLPCDVVGLHQYNGALLNASPWKPVGAPPKMPYSQLAPALLAHRESLQG